MNDWKSIERALRAPQGYLIAVTLANGERLVGRVVRAMTEGGTTARIRPVGTLESRLVIVREVVDAKLASRREVDAAIAEAAKAITTNTNTQSPSTHNASAQPAPFPTNGTDRRARGAAPPHNATTPEALRAPNPTPPSDLENMAKTDDSPRTIRDRGPRASADLRPDSVESVDGPRGSR